MMLVLLLLALASPWVTALDNGLAHTPQMGYNSWYDLMGTLTEESIKATADKMVELGLVELGYNYLNLDDCWAGKRNSKGELTADENWTGGTLKHIADYVHSKGMMFGTYTDRGTQTCAGRPGAQGHEAQDAQTYADWGVDYLKEDSCHASGSHAEAYRQYGLMRDGLNKTGRPILFSLCGWNAWYAPPDPSLGYGGGTTLGNSYRIGPDDTNWHGVLTNIDINANLAPFAGPGGWNDPCLLLGETYKGPSNQRITPVQSRSQFSMWAVMASPLLISANVRNMSAMNLETYKNKEVIAVNQDELGQQGIRVVGGPLLQHGGGSSRAAHTSKCVAGSKTQQWEFGVGERDEYVLSLGHAGLALNSDDCHSDLIWYSAARINANSTDTCCGNVGANNLRFRMDWPNKGQLGMEPCAAMAGTCVTSSVGSNLLTLSKCQANDAAQTWKYDAATKTISQSGRCFDSAAAPDVPSTATNVWARNLTGAAKAVVFLNAGPSVANITCDAACFARMVAVAPGVTHYQSRDLWAHTDNGTVAAAAGLSVMVEPSAVVMLKLTPMKQPAQ